MKAGWQVKKLQEVVDSSCSLSYGIVQPGEDFQDGLPIVRPVDLTSKFIALSGLKRINPIFAESYKRTNLSGNEILMCVRGNTGVVSIASQELNGANVTRGIVPIRFDSKKINHLFGFYILSSDYVQKQIKEKTYGAALMQINISDLKNINIHFPEEKEQRRIVAILDEAFADIAAAKEKAEQNLKNAKEVFEAHLQGIFATPKPDWQTKKIGDICKSIEYGTSSKSQKSGKVPVLRMGNIQDGKLDWSDLVYSDNLDEIEKYSLRNGDVLFNRTNSAEHVGKTAIFRGEQKAISAGYLIRINVKKNIINPEFLAIYLNSRKIREYGFSVMTSSVNQANISGSKLKEYPFLMPPLSEQRQIVSQLDSLSAETSSLESLYQQKLSNLEELKKSLLQQAFSGAL